MKKIKKKKSKPSIEMTLWGVILSYPDLHNPKPYKGKIYYRTDALFDKTDPQIKAVKAAIKEVCTQAFGDDESEWPEKIPMVQNGDTREDSKGYAGRRFITASTQSPVPVVDPRGKEFNPQMVKGGMFGNIAISISAWEYDGDMGVSIYLQGVQIDTSKKSLNFGGGKSIEKMFARDDDASEDEDDNSDNDEDEDDEDYTPPKKKKKRPVDEEEDEDMDESDEDDDEEEEPAPKKKKKKRPVDEDDDEE